VEAEELPTPLAPSRDPPPGETIGPYRLLEPIGEGGMGSVFLAEQTTPIRRRVALKLIKPGMGSREVVARFEAERQALALMSHPGIAKVLDAGSAPDGRPFFVMEHVAGVPITEYCDTHRLGVGERLELFVAVCRAIHHAHQRGILHRDVKPSNVLVAIEEGEPRPKVIDFGLAKALNQRLTEKTLYTQRGLLVGTPAYMSPEQASGSGLDVDVTTDVYSLGVLLDELLTGAPPFDPGRLQRAGPVEVERILREEEPPRPSTRVMVASPDSSEAAARRGSDPPALARRLRGDLDWIVLKALEKDRTRRYPSASELAADVERHLKSEPVLARPPSFAYRVGRLAVRHKVGFTAAAALLLLLVGFAATMAVQSARLARERDRALAAEGQAVREAETAEQVTEFLVGLFETVDPSEARGRTVTAREVLDRGAERIERELADQPAVQASLQEALGRVYTGLGLHVEAERLLEAALATRERLFGEESLEVAATLYYLAEPRLDKTDFAGAEPLARRALAIRRRLLGGESLEVAASQQQVGWSSRRPEEAEALMREALAIRRRLLGAKHPLVAESLAELGEMLTWRWWDFDRGEPLLQEGLAIQRRLLGPDHPEVLESLQDLANHFARKGEWAAAEPLYREAMGLKKRILGEHSSSLAYTLSDLAFLRATLGDFPDAEGLGRQALAIAEGSLGEEDAATLLVLSNLGGYQRLRGDLEGSETTYREALRRLGNHPGGRLEEQAKYLAKLASLIAETGRTEEAEEIYRQALEITRDADSLLGLADLGDRAGRVAEARALYEEALALERPKLEHLCAKRPQAWYLIAASEARIGTCLQGLGRHAEAEPLLLSSLPSLRRWYGDRDYRVRDAARRLVDLYEAWGNQEQAAEYRALAAPPRSGDG
jgi:serine/threonine protein kinase